MLKSPAENEGRELEQDRGNPSAVFRELIHFYTVPNRTKYVAKRRPFLEQQALIHKIAMLRERVIGRNGAALRNGAFSFSTHCEQVWKMERGLERSAASYD